MAGAMWEAFFEASGGNLSTYRGEISPKEDPFIFGHIYRGEISPFLTGTWRDHPMTCKCLICPW